jgi:hypothetical protein
VGARRLNGLVQIITPEALSRIMPHVAQGIFRVVGQLMEGWLTVDYVRHCVELPVATLSPDTRVISIRDDLWIDQVPIGMVGIEDRMPNTLLKVTVIAKTEVIHVERTHAA